MPDRRRRPRPLHSVTTYLLAGFGICTLFLSAVVLEGSRQSFARERAFAERDLAATTRETQYLNSDLTEEILDLRDSIGSDPRVLALDPVQCREVFESVERALGEEHVHVLRPDGSEVCAAWGRALTPTPFVAGPWVDRAMRDGEAVVLEPAIEPTSGRPFVLLAAPLLSADGDRIGVIAAVLGTSEWISPLPPDAPSDTILFVVDQDHDLVLSASPGAPVAVGDHVGDTAVGRSMRSGDTVVDADGVRRIYADVTLPETGWHVMAGLDADVVLGPARAELRRNMLWGAATLGIVLLLAWQLHHRLARPIRRVGRAITASLEGDPDARAPLGGPTELAEVASAFNDLIVERHTREADLWHRARQDALTGLPNRTALGEHLASALRFAEADARVQVVVLFLDLDRFKHVNDAYGHAIGDRVLIELGARLRHSGVGGFLSRFGGDEYVLVFAGPLEAAAAHTRAREVAAVVQRPVEVDGAALHLTASVGIAVAVPGDSPDDLLRNADTAMYRSKERGSAGYAVFDQPMRDQVLHRASVERDLHTALASGQLWLSYQPKLDLSRGGPAGFEALARWTHPTRGLVSPVEFIPIAEDSGLITQIGAWALADACRQAAAWRTLNDGVAVPVAVNLSARQLADPALPDLIAGILETNGARPGDLVVELTESAVLMDLEGVSKRLGRLRDAGVRISIDDFGTGYSSLSYLQQLPIDELKIDRSFVSRVPVERSSTAIIGSVIDLAHAIGLTVVAEGVERADQLTTLRDLGCDLAQGFFIAHPEAAGDATTRLQQEMAVNRRAHEPKIAASSAGATASSWA